MINYSNLDSARKQYREIVVKLFSLIEEMGGTVARGVIMDPDEGYKIATDDSKCRWIKEYFGDFNSWDAVVEYARGLMYEDLRPLKLTDPMRNLISALKRQSTTTGRISYHGLSDDLSSIGRLKAMIRNARNYDDIYYESNTIDPAGKRHILEYLYKFSPLSSYHGPLWLHNARGYGVTREVKITESELRYIADAVVCMQRRYGILDAVGKHEPKTIEETQIRARENNPTNAHSIPTMTNGKNEEARQEQIKLAHEYEEHFRELGVMPFIGGKRVQQGGNMLREIIHEIEPDFDWETQFPSDALIDKALDWCWTNRPRTTSYVDKLPSDFTSRWMTSDRLPNSQEERESLVANGTHDKCILLTHRPKMLPNGQINWKFNFMLTEASPWKLIMDDPELPDEVSNGYEDVMLSKNRVVFAGSGPTTLNQERFTHVYKDYVKEYSRSHGHGYLSDPWYEPTGTLCTLTNMWAFLNHQPNAEGDVVLGDPEWANFAEVLSGDDKSSFDNFQAFFFHALYNACFIGPLFDPKWHPLMSYLALQTVFPRLITYDGIYLFSESMPSGHGTTNDQDTNISQIAGQYDESRRTGIMPSVRFEMYDKIHGGMLAQGDDYEGIGSGGVDNNAKQESFDNLGLIVSVRKSLISKSSLEFIRYYGSGEYRYIDRQRGLDHLALHHPYSHAFVKVNFGEEISKNPPAIEDLADIMRYSNLQFHPKFTAILKDAVNYTKLGMGCRNVPYVPDYMLKAWREAGSPPPPSQYHVIIDSPMKLNEVAASEAEHMGESLESLTKSWTMMQYGKGNFEDLNVVKLLEAIRTGDQNALDEYDSRFYHV